MGSASNNEEYSDAWWASHFDESAWHVKWGFDSGDCFTVFPLLPKLPEESEEARWERSFVPVRGAGELLCIESEVVEVLLHGILEARFDATLTPNGPEGYPWRSPRFDWYSENAYTIEVCEDICSLMRSAANGLAQLPAEMLVRLDEAGGIETGESALEDDAWWSPLVASDAQWDCLRIAELLEKVVGEAERQGALVCFSGP